MSRVVVQNQFSALADKINATVAALQYQCAEDRRRLVNVERKIETRLEERLTGGDSREKWAEVQGSVNGLIEEMQSVTRRVEGLDERLWARTSGSESSKQRNREMEQQVQALEHSVRLAGATTEEAQKRQAAKLRRSEHSIEEAVRRLTKLEEQSRAAVQQRDSYFESRLGTAEQQLAQLAADLGETQLQLEDVAAGGMVVGADAADVDASVMASPEMDDALRATERSIAAVERRLTQQVEEVATSLATIRVKVEGQMQRVGTLSERLETAHTPALESLRSDLINRGAQDRRELEGELTLLRARVQENADGNDEVRESLRQAQAEIAALGLKHPQHDESQALRDLGDRLAMQERELMDQRARLDGFGGAVDEELQQEGLTVDGDDLQGLALAADADAGARAAGTGGLSAEMDEALQASERNVAQLEKRLSSQVEELTASLASLKVKVEGQTQRVGALAERLETAHEPAVEALRETVRSEAVQLRAQDRREIDAELASLKNQLEDLDGARDHDDIQELRAEIGECKTQIKDALLKAQPSAGAGTPEGLGRDVSELKKKVADLAASRDNDDMEELRSDLDECKSQVQDALQRAQRVADNGHVEGLGREVSELKKRLVSLEASQDNDVVEDLRADIDECKTQVQQALKKSQAPVDTGNVEGLCRDVAGLKKKLEDLEASHQSGAVEDLRSEIGECKTQIKDALMKAQSSVDAGNSEGLNRDVAGLKKKLEDLEASRQSGAVEDKATPQGSTAAADEARAKVQERLEKLTTHFSAELASLGKHQDALLAARASQETAEAQLDSVSKRVKCLEDSAGALRQDIDMIQGPKKVGIFMNAKDGFSLADARSKLELLSEQVSDLQAKGVRATSKPEEKLGKPSSPEASLNFSLTEVKKEANDGSLNFSATESKKDLSLTDSVPLLSAPPLRMAAVAAAAPTAAVAAAAVAASAAAAEDLEVESPSSSTPSSPLAQKGADALDGLLGDSGLKTAAGKPRLAAVPESPFSPTGRESPFSPTGADANLEVSMSGVSCNDVSVGGDYSVEDSRELDKCDHVEEVKAVKAKAGDAKPAAPNTAAPAAAPTAAISTLPASTATDPSPPQADPEGNDDYDDSFEDGMSVPESIVSEAVSSRSSAS